MSEVMKRLAKLPKERRAEFLAMIRAELERGDEVVLEPRDRTGPLPLSYAQETLWFLDRLAPGLPTYNVPFVLRLLGPLDIEALRTALATVVARHESLRTSLVETPDGPVQRIAGQVPVELPVVQVPGADPAQRLAQAMQIATAEAHTAFDLSAGPLWRARLLRLEEALHIFVFNVHHVVFDGWSLGVFSQEMAEAYRAALAGETPALAPLPVQYPDYAIWQREWLAGETLDKLVDYWRGQLAGAPTLELPTDRPRPRRVGFEGTLLTRAFSAELTKALHAFARQEGTTPYTAFVAAFVVLMHRYSG
jgi:Condensation domain